MNPFLKARHWQLFILILGIPLMLQVIWMNYFFAYSREGFSPEGWEKFSETLPLIVGFGSSLGLVLFGWYISVALGLRPYTPEKIRLNLKPFIVASLFVLVHFTFLGALFFRAMEDPNAWRAYYSNWAITFLLIAHVMAMGCVFYIPYYAAKAFKTASLRRKVKREEVVVEFLMMWVLFIGIWFLQPKINQLTNGPLNPELKVKAKKSTAAN